MEGRTLNRHCLWLQEQQSLSQFALPLALLRQLWHLGGRHQAAEVLELLHLVPLQVSLSPGAGCAWICCSPLIRMSAIIA